MSAQFRPTAHFCLDRRNHQLFVQWGCVPMGHSVIQTQRFFCRDVLGFATSRDVSGISSRSGLRGFFLPVNLNRAYTSLLTFPTGALCSDLGLVRTDQIQ